MEEQKQINSRKFNISQRSFSVHFNVFCFALAAGGVRIHQRQKRVFFLKIFFRFPFSTLLNRVDVDHFAFARTVRFSLAAWQNNVFADVTCNDGLCLGIKIMSIVLSFEVSVSPTQLLKILY